MLDTLQAAWAYFLSHQGEFFAAAGEHLTLAFAVLALALLIGVPGGILAVRSQRAGAILGHLVNGLRVIPSLAVLFLVVPYLGLSPTSAGVALTLLALPPILLNTAAGFRTLDPAVLEAARSAGMTPTQVLTRVELPLALPVILAGVRIAAVEVIASATLAAFVGSGGLGIYITRGFALYDISILLVGGLPVALLALIVEGALAGLQKLALRPA